MKISIVTPSFNQGQFISKCLTSVQNQKGSFSVEHIIMDNCSIDSTRDALDKYTASPGKVDVHVFVETDEGQSAAINKGFGLATGDIVCWLNTDEWYEDGALDKVAKFFADNPEVDVLFGDCNFVDESGNIVKQKREYFYFESMLIFYGCYIPSCATFLRRKIIDSGIILDPNFKVAMDLDWYVRISKAHYKIAHLPNALASFTWHDNNISINFKDRGDQEWRIIKDRNGSILGPYWFKTCIYAIIRYFWLIVRVLTRLARNK